MVALAIMKTNLGVRRSDELDTETYNAIENRLKKKAKLLLVEKQAPPLSSIPTNCFWEAQEAEPSPKPLEAPKNVTVQNSPQDVPRSGRWSLDEKIMFLYGLSKFGKGRWKKISVYVPDR